jgi:hypothetical protein
MLYALLALAVVVIGFFVWRITSVSRGAGQRDDKIMELLEPIGGKIADGQTLSPSDIESVARFPQARPMLYELLKHFEKLDLFPDRMTELESQGEALLAYWMMHPNELQDPPAQTELVESCPRDIDGKQARFLVYRYKMERGHWAGDDWILGLSGPFFENDVPYSGIASAFSRCGDKYGQVQPSELVDWFIDMVQAKNR